MRMSFVPSILSAVLVLLSAAAFAQSGGAEPPAAPPEPTRMAKPGMKNKALEADFMAAIVQQEWKETPLRAVITSDEWRIARHPVSGIPLRRMLNGQVAVKTPKGICRVFEIGIVQEHDGSKYGKSHYLSVGDNFDIACDDVKK